MADGERKNLLALLTEIKDQNVGLVKRTQKLVEKTKSSGLEYDPGFSPS